jgi:signal recognition particle subunit SRP54
MQGIMGLLPGVAKMKNQLAESGIGDSMLKRQRSIIGSMTKEERKKPDILAASRKRRIAAGAGVDVAEINRLLKQHRQMSDAFKMMARDGGKGFARMAGMMGGMPGMGGSGAGMPGGGMGGGGMPDLNALKAMGGGLPGLGSGAPNPPGGFPGLPGLPFGKPKS